MQPLSSRVDPTKRTHDVNSSYGRVGLSIHVPNVTTSSTLKKQLEKKDIYIGTPQDQVGITHDPFNISLACRSVQDLRKVQGAGSGAAPFSTQLLNASPAGPFHTASMIAEREGYFGANFKLNNTR
tara:strand:+ start:447 stop:824 length:378 start_codon:yes stop_codon:yes gene_type:complete